MTRRRDWDMVWSRHAPADIANEMLAIAARRGQCHAYVHGDVMLLHADMIEEWRDDLTAVAEPGTSHRKIVEKLVEGFEASKGDSP
jgi:hypothetical protein